MVSSVRGALIAGVLVAVAFPGLAHGRAPAYAARVQQLKQGVLLDLRSGARPPGKKPRMGDVKVFLPKGFRPRGDRVDFHVHFHGQVTTAAKEMRRMRLVRQLVGSRRSAALVVPQGPVWARKNRWGRLHRPGGLGRMLDGVLKALAAPAPRGPGLVGLRRGVVLMSVHSGGYSVAAHSLVAGGVTFEEVFLFDALFGYHRRFLDWAAAKKGRRLVTFHARRDIRARHRALLALLRTRKQAFRQHDEVLELRPAQLGGAPVIVVGSRLGHYSVVHRQGYLRLCLATSRLDKVNSAP